MVQGCEWITFDVRKTVGLDYALCVCLVGKVDGQGAVLVGQPLEVYSDEPVDGSRQFDLELGSKQTFKLTPNIRVIGEVDEVINVEA